MRCLLHLPDPRSSPGKLTTKPHILLPLAVLFEPVRIWPLQLFRDGHGRSLKPPPPDSEPIVYSNQIPAAPPPSCGSVNILGDPWSWETQHPSPLVTMSNTAFAWLSTSPSQPWCSQPQEKETLSSAHCHCQWGGEWKGLEHGRYSWKNGIHPVP